MTSRRWAIAIFLGVAGLLLAMHGNRFLLTNDEGILLEPARQIAQGSRPYVDFFGYMSPGSYWIQAALFWIFGVSYWVGRLPVILGFAAQCAMLFWLVARFASQRAAAAAVAIYAGFQIADPTVLTAQHRWDSGTLALLGVCLAITQTRNRLLASGVACAAAGWCTPSMIWLNLVVIAWLLFAKERRSGIIPFAIGLSALTASAAGFLAVQGALFPFAKQMLWLAKNYSRVNVIYYGEVLGGYGKLLEGSHGFELIVSFLLVVCIALPALVPVAALTSWMALARKQPELRATAVLLVLSMIALIASTIPRADVMHLALVSALPYALVTIAIARLFTLRVSAITAFSVLPFALLFSLNGISGWWKLEALETPAGNVRADANLGSGEKLLIKKVHPGDSLFVYPYMPVHYFITQAQNPSGFAFMAAGMMTDAEEGRALDQLKTNPPQWVLYMQLSRDEFMRMFPHAHNVNHNFPALEKWLKKNYEPSVPAVNVAGYSLWKRPEAPVTVSSVAH